MEIPLFYISLKKESRTGSYRTGAELLQEQFFYKSVKNTNGAQGKGYAAGKKISGIKRHIAVDTQGLPHAFAVTAANITDRQGALLTFE